MTKKLLTQKQKEARLKRLRKKLIAPLPIFLLVLFVIGIVLLGGWLSSEGTYRTLKKEGVVTTAKVLSTKLSYSGGYKNHVLYDTADPNKAQFLSVQVSFIANGVIRYAQIESTFSVQHNDHQSVYQDAVKGSLQIRYLPSSPSTAASEAEFTHPKENPYFGGR